MSTKSEVSVRLSRVVATDPDTAFRAWTEAEQLKRWACPDGEVSRASSDVRVGGRYSIEMLMTSGDRCTASGEYREVERPSRLAYTWAWSGDMVMGETLVTVEFREVAGGTEVVLTHEHFPDAEARDGHEQGWTVCLELLAGMFA